MKEINIQELIEQIKNTEFPEGTCCATNYCRDCRYMEMDNDAYNDGKRRCSWRGEWLKPSTLACYKFSY